jgi:ABC-type multidrug transport system ATPase subunit
METFGLTADAGRKVQDLSGGFRRRVQVAKVFMVDTPVMFLDEFSTGMDPILKRAVMDLLRREAAGGRTIVLTTQILSEAEDLCDDLLIIDRGLQIARGDMNALKLLSERVYEVSLTFDRLPADLDTALAGYEPLRKEISHNTVRLKLKDDESRVLALATALAARGHLLRIEINGASLEDIFIELTQKGAR